MMMMMMTSFCECLVHFTDSIPAPQLAHTIVFLPQLHQLLSSPRLMPLPGFQSIVLVWLISVTGQRKLQVMSLLLSVLPTLLCLPFWHNATFLMSDYTIPVELLAVYNYMIHTIIVIAHKSPV